MKQPWWQILPLGPTGIGNSPYMSFSAFAGNVNLLSPELLERDGLVTPQLGKGKSYPDDHVDFDAVIEFKSALLRAASDGLAVSPKHQLAADFSAYRDREKYWLPDYGLFMAIREALGNRGLIDWPVELLAQ